MSEQDESRDLFLCGGLQSSGSTLISWCFLQRHDMNGVLDADNDLLTDVPTHWGQPFSWCKTTICCFRLTELIAHYQDAGWRVRPLLVVRDVRHVWASLSKKPYGCNGITAEDPPLRMRLRRFKEDWEAFRTNRWPMIRFETFVREPEPVLREVCAQLALSWDEAMMSWPKDRSLIANTKHGNQTFRETRSRGLLDTLRPTSDGLDPEAIPSADLEFLEREFAEFNQSNTYAAHLPVMGKAENAVERAMPNFEMTRRYKWEIRRKPLRWLMQSLGFARAEHELAPTK